MTTRSWSPSRMGRLSSSGPERQATHWPHAGTRTNTNLGSPRGIIGIEISCIVVRPCPCPCACPIRSYPRTLLFLSTLITRMYTKLIRRRRPYPKMLGRPHSPLRNRFRLTTRTYIDESPQFLGRCNLYPNLASPTGQTRSWFVRLYRTDLRHAQFGAASV